MTTSHLWERLLSMFPTFRASFFDVARHVVQCQSTCKRRTQFLLDSACMLPTLCMTSNQPKFVFLDRCTCRTCLGSFRSMCRVLSLRNRLNCVCRLIHVSLLGTCMTSAYTASHTILVTAMHRSQSMPSLAVHDLTGVFRGHDRQRLEDTS